MMVFSHKNGFSAGNGNDTDSPGPTPLCHTLFGPPSHDPEVLPPPGVFHVDSFWLGFQIPGELLPLDLEPPALASLPIHFLLPPHDNQNIAPGGQELQSPDDFINR